MSPTRWQNAFYVYYALRALGTGPVVASVFAHKPGVARLLNAFLGDLARQERGVVGLGTVLPGEADARAIVRTARYSGR